MAGLLVRLIAIDDKMPFGSPISPVLTTLVHRPMFDEIYALCEASDLKMSLWVDDLTISGVFVEGALVAKIREIIRRNGFKSHKIKFRSGARPVAITGVPVNDGRVVAPKALHARVQAGYDDLRAGKTDAEKIYAIDRLLSALGTYRYHLGARTSEGRKASNRMHALRQRRGRLNLTVVTGETISPMRFELNQPGASESALPWE